MATVERLKGRRTISSHCLQDMTDLIKALSDTLKHDTIDRNPDYHTLTVSIFFNTYRCYVVGFGAPS